MKTLFRVLLFICLFAVIAVACQKNSSPANGNKSTLTLSKQSVKQGEPLVVTANETGANFIKWSVTPSASTWISAPTNATTNFLFYSQGTYLISANYFLDSTASAPYDSSSVYISVSDSIYNDTIAFCNSLVQAPIKTGDMLILTPVNYSDTGLVLSMHSQDIYGNNYPGFGNVEATSNNNTYSFSFNNITEYPCYSTAQPMVATGILTFAGLVNGSYNVTIAFNGTSYQGVLAVTGTSCTFSWNYSSGVIISPLQIQKQ